MGILSFSQIVIVVISLMFIKANGESSSSVSASPSATPSTSQGATSTSSAAATSSSPAVSAATSATPTTASASSTAAIASNTAGTPSSATSTAGGSPTIAPTTTKTTSSSTSSATPTAEPSATTSPPPATAEIVAQAKLTGETYNPKYADKNSDEYKNFSKRFEDGMENQFPKGTQVKVNSVVQGSVIVNFTVILKVTAGYDPVKNLTDMIKSGKLAGFTVDKSYIKVEENYQGVKLTDWKLDTNSYLSECCKSSIGHYKMMRVCNSEQGGSCYGIKLEYDEDCGKATSPPVCTACSLKSLPVATLLMAIVYIKIFF